MEYQSNNSNSAVITASNGTANSIASNTASGSENRKPATAQQLVRENVQYLIEQLEAGHSETLTAFLRAMAISGNILSATHGHCEATPFSHERSGDVRMESAWTLRQQGRKRHCHSCACHWQAQQTRAGCEHRRYEREQARIVRIPPCICMG